MDAGGKLDQDLRKALMEPECSKYFHDNSSTENSLDALKL